MSGRKSTDGLKVGDKAPDFMIPDYDGEEVSLSGFRGKKVVLYLQGKDSMPRYTGT